MVKCAFCAIIIQFHLLFCYFLRCMCSQKFVCVQKCADSFECQINVNCCNLLSYVKPDECSSKARVHPKVEFQIYLQS